jgi:hypothetical protein
MNLPRLPKLCSLVTVFVVVVALGACGQAPRSGTGITPASDDYGVASAGANLLKGGNTTITGGTEAQRTLLKEITAGIDSSDVPAIDIGDPVEGFGSDPSIGASGSTWLAFTIPFDRRDPNYVRAFWEDMIVVGAFRDRSYAIGLPDVLGFNVGPSASLLPGPSSHDVLTDDPGQLTKLISDGVAHAGLKLVSISFAAPAKLAPLVVASTDSPKQYVAENNSPGTTVFGDLDRWEGTYLEVVDSSGAPILETAYSGRSLHGIGWTLPGLQGSGAGCPGAAPCSDGSG